MGMRLRGEKLENIVSKNIKSEGITKGSIQIPGDGKPIILLSDHPTIGGYPKIGNVITADYDKLVQKTPGTKIKFKLVDLPIAENAFREYVRKFWMHFIYKIPGPILVLLGGFSLSWGGLIIRSFESASIWQILFYRSLFFLWALITFLFLTYGKETFKKIKIAGLPGLVGGIFLSGSFVAYMYSMTETTVANVVNIISTQTIFLQVLAYIFLKEKISQRGIVDVSYTHLLAH